MLSIEEIKLLIEKLEKAKTSDFQTLIDQSLAELKELAQAVDHKNQHEIDRLDKTKAWYEKDNEHRHTLGKVNEGFDKLLEQKVEQKIKHFAKMGAESALYNSLEIGPGYGRFSRNFLSWKLNYFLEINPRCKSKLEKLFHPRQHQYMRFHLTDRTKCDDIPDSAFNFVFSWDTFVYFTQEHIKEYLTDIHRTMIPGGYALIHYCNCEYEFDLNEAKRGYWNYNTKNAMQQIIKDCGYNVIEMDQIRPGANYAIFQKPGDQNPVLYQKTDLPAEK